MQITAEINTDDIVQEIMDSSDLDRHINDVVDNLVNDQVEEHLGRLDIDDIDGFERRVEEIARDVVSEILDDEINGRVRDAVEQAMVDAPDPQDADDRISDLEAKVEALTDTVERLVDALSAAALLLGVVAKG
jgi:3-methyladenine DNA glycosylase/8-oxoguanine DNA glycosylase